MAQARSRLLAAREATKRSDGPFVVRLSQECVELSLKALLRSLAIEPPKWHDLSDVLRANAGRLPPSIAAHLEEIASASRDLRAERERSMYGDEAEGLAASEIFGEASARSALDRATMVFDLVCLEVK